jgi:ATP-dependent helicase/nuclease subunit B
MVRFILGRAGTGKTRHCFEQMEALERADPLGPPVFLLLPRQATFQAERELTIRLGGFARIRVVSLDDLGKLILETCGDVGIPQVNPIGRRLVIGHLLRQHENSLRFYGAAARRPGLAAEIDSTFGELERCNADSDKLELTQKNLRPDDPLAAKLADIAMLLRSYNDYIGEDRLDPRRRMDKMVERAADCSLLQHAHLFIDEFYEFGAHELTLLAAIAKLAARTEIALLLDPDSPVVALPHLLPQDLSLFHRTERTYRALYLALQDKVPIQPPLLLRATRRFGTASLAAVEAGWFNTTAPLPAVEDDAIERFTAPDARAEVDAVARRILRAIQSGLRLRDIAVLVREPDDYHTLIDASFTEHGLAHFIDRRRAALHHPLLQFIRAALSVSLHHWPHEMVMVLIKTGLAGISDTDADRLENYVLLHRIRGRAWESPQPWSFRRHFTRRTDDDDAGAADDVDPSAQLDALRQELVKKLSPLSARLRAATTARPAPLPALVRGLLEMLEIFGVRQTLAQWISQSAAAGELEQPGEHEQVWNNLIELLKQMNELLEHESVSAEDFLSMLDVGLEGFDLALPPPAIDRVLVGEPDRTRTASAKLVFVLGLNDGVFPKLSRPDCVLSDSERRRLGRENLHLDPDTHRRLLDERLLAYVAFTRGSQRLVVSRPLADARGRASNASAFWVELERLCPGCPSTHEPRAASGPQADPRTIGTPRQLVTTLMGWARKPLAGGDDQPWPALYQWLAHKETCGDALNTMRERAWRALSYTNAAAVTAESAGELFPSPLAATAGQLETFAACPFRHFARYGLRLESRESADVTTLDLSNAYHHVLERLVGAVLQLRQDWCEIPAELMTQLVQRYAAEIGRQLRAELMLSSARNRYMLQRIETELKQAVSSQCEMHRRGRYRPAFAGLRFGDGQRLPAYAVTTGNGGQVRLSGQIDRVDLHSEDDTFTVSDYRLRGRPLSLEQVHHGLNLQLLTYLLVVSANGEKLVGRPIAPAAAFLLGVLRPTEAVDHPEDAPDPQHPDFHLRQKPRGIIHREAVASLDQNLTGGQSAAFSVYLTKEGKLGYRNRSDAAEPDEFDGLLNWVEKRIGQLGDRILGGDVKVWPYWLGGKTPCPTCSFRSVCRFEPVTNEYHFLKRLKREDVLAQCCANGADADGGGSDGTP